MREGKYRILNNYGGYDGMSWRVGPDGWPLEFDTIDAALVEIMRSSCCEVFVVRMIEPEGT